jgi:hypothetical protein
MAQNKALEVYKGLPDWARGVVAVGGIGIAFYIGYTLVRRVRTQAEIKEAQVESDTAKEELEKLKNQGIKPTISNSQAESLVNSLREAMNGCGSDEEMVYDTFRKLNNDADVQLLISRWGVRYYMPCAVTDPISYAIYLRNDKKFGGNISAWLNSDLTNSEIKKINDILAKKGIKHKF